MESILEKSPLFYEKYMKAVGDQINAGFIPKATPLADIHLNSNLKGDEPTGNKAYVLIFTIVALFILVIAGINYMNMATARSTKRAKEVGLRKVIGAVRSQLMRQFLSESLILALIAFLISLLAVSLILPSFNELAGKNLVFGIETSGIILWTLLISIGVGLLSGSYPSFYLSAFAPIKVLKGKINTGKSKGSLRKILVVFQFIISISMIVGTLVVTKQLNYMRSKDLGFAKDNILVTTIQADTNLLKKMPTFREELLQNPNVKDLSTSNGYPGNIGGIIVMKVEQDTKLGTSDSTASSSGGSQMVEESLNFTMIDYDFLNLYEIKFKDGRNFSREMGTDLQEGVIINEACAKELGWTDNPLGKKIGFGLQLDGTFTRSTKVIGVVKDFNYRSLHNAVEPLALFLTDRPLNAVSIKIGTENRQQTIQFIEDKWNKFGAIHPFDYNFLKDTMDDMYQAEEKIGKVFTIAALLSVFIALLGLLGLSSFIAEQRTKEIGIRKVVGATLESILAFLFKEFVILILIAFVIASPIAWYLLNNWLDSNFVYATNIGLLTFLLAGFIAFVIGILTISFHIYRAASSNPVDALKYE
jgi:putative ABC transport system permease protein